MHTPSLSLCELRLQDLGLEFVRLWYRGLESVILIPANFCLLSTPESLPLLKDQVCFFYLGKWKCCWVYSFDNNPWKWNVMPICDPIFQNVSIKMWGVVSFKMAMIETQWACWLPLPGDFQLASWFLFIWVVYSWFCLVSESKIALSTLCFS